MTTEDHPELEQTHALADGELSGEALELAQDHLATCERCQAELSDIMQLEAIPMPSIAAGVTPLAWYRKRPVQIASVLVAAAAATALILGTRKHKPVTPETPTRIALATKRTMEARLSWQGAADYREYSVQRGSTNAKEPISLSALADLEKSGDLHGVGALALLGGDLEQAKKYLALAGDSPDVLADHAALELQLGDPEGALALADQALARMPDQMTATWNRGLALRELGLRHDAADAFRVVAKHSEPGWATEATQRADELERGFTEELALTQRVTAAATPLARTGAGLSLDDARSLPGLARIELYDALRAAPTAEAVATLKPLAEAIDAGSHDSTAVAAVANAKPDPAVSKAYLSLLTEDKPDRAHILGVLRTAHADDALVVALLKFDESEVPDADLPELTKLAAASQDPWIRLIGIEQRAGNALRKNDLPTAEAALLGASELCKSGAPSYRCMKISMLLGQTYTAWQRLPEARAALADAWTRARALSQWEQDDILIALTDLAVVADDIVGGGLPLVRAYTGELVARAAIEEKQNLRDNACDVERWGHERVAALLLIQLRTPDAARELAAAPTCKVSHRTPAALVTGIFVRAELLHVAGKPAEVVELQKSIAALRATELPVGERALLDHSEGRALIGGDAHAGDALLHRAITVGTSAPHNDDAGLAVGMSYSVLAIAAAKRGDATAALGLLADELGLKPRATCVLGLVVDGGDVAVLALGNDGKPLVDTYERTTTDLVASKVVPGRVIEALKACADVDVIARPPYHGLARILPDDLAWRYVTARARPIGPPTGPSLVIADVRPPPALGLPHLAAWNNAMNATELTGAAATPSRVLSAIGESRDVVIHAHGLADHGDASYLALSPEGEDRYALTAGEVARAKFKTNPLVILAACEAARSAPVFQTRWSLPAAFVTAGARAVVAPTSAVPDDGAAKFFDELRARTAAGQPVAAVVRDLRKTWLSDPTNDWVRDIVVFE